jgi:hypothetical protein
VGILQAKRGAGHDHLVADMIAPTPRPGHLAEIAMNDNEKDCIRSAQALTGLIAVSQALSMSRRLSASDTILFVIIHEMGRRGSKHRQYPTFSLS